MNFTFQKLLYTAALIACLVSSVSARELIILTGRADSAAAAQVSRLRRIVSADSARIISPSVRSVLTADSVVYEIETAKKTDSVVLWVHHSEETAETLGVFTSPPYKAVWKKERTGNRDQIHLQFGYTLYCSDTLVITSPPKPHRWVLEHRKSKPSKKSYRIKETVQADNFPIDCDLLKWKKIRSGQIGDHANFKLLWSKHKLFFIAEVKIDTVTRDDFVELHIDLYHDRASFSGINHRSIRFNPRSRSNSFVVDLDDGSFKLNDSVNVLISSEMEWKHIINESGYIIEAMIPFFALSDKEFPPAKFGLDVSVMRADKSGNKIFNSWAGANQFSRYSPKNWGTAKLSQAWLALKAAFLSIIAIIFITLILSVLQVVLHKRKANQYEKEDMAGFSPLTESVICCIEEHLSDENFCMNDLLKAMEKTEEEIVSSIKQDLDCDFERLLLFRRIKRSQRLMRNSDLDIEQISLMSGFGSAEKFTEQYIIQMKVDPKISREAVLKQIMEETQEEED